ncbi:hypothetical protein IJ579_01275 [bacterium]|nr:hypothetical protein [bacterium]
MKQFMKDNTITYNLMSFTGFKSLLIFTMLLEGPKSYYDLQKAISEHQYLHETVSIDTLRIYINTLKAMGCNVEKTTTNRVAKYYIKSQPFELKITDEQAKSVLKVYKAIAKSITLTDFIALQSFFEKFARYITNEDLKNKFENISPLNNIDSSIIKDLLKYAKNNTEITVLYNSPNSGKKNITILTDRLGISNNKLYVYGINSEYNNYSSFLVSKIIKIVSVNLQKSKLTVPELTVLYELKNDIENFEPLACERIIEKTHDKLVVEIKSKNKFDIMQRIMSHTSKCKVISPEFQKEVIACLKQMKEGYFEK